MSPTGETNATGIDVSVSLISESAGAEGEGVRGAVISITLQGDTMPTLEEQETIITQNRADDYVSIWTSSTPDIAYFRKTKGFELVREDSYQGEVVSAEFRVAKDRANIRKILKRQMSDAQRDAARELFISRNQTPVESSQTI